MPVRFRERDFEALLEAMRRAEEYKPWQVAKRKVFAEYGIAGSAKDKIFTAMMYRAWMMQGFIDRVISEALGCNVSELDPYTRAAARIYVFQKLVADREGHHDITLAMEEYIPKILERFGGDVGAFKRLVERVYEAASRVDEIEAKFMVSRFIFERVASFIGRSEAERLFTFLLTWIPPLSMRVNTLKTSVKRVVERLRKLGFEPQISRYVPTVVKITRGDVKHEVFRMVKEGLIILQDEASAAASLILNPREGETVVDLCAAPGGKTSHIAELTRLKAHIIAFEPYYDRALRLKETMELVGAETVVDIVMADGRRAPDMLGEESVDVVLVDPPCSSTGTIAKNPDVRWRLRPEELPKLTTLQRELLEAAVRLVRPGGRILYSVCSLLREEGEDVVATVLEKYRGVLKPLKQKMLFEPSPVQPWAQRAWPHKHHTSGFYYALLVKTRSLA